MSFIDNITRNLELLRRNKGLTQDVVARQLGVSRVTYIGLETGKTKPNVEILSKLATIYNVSLIDIIDIPRNNEKFQQVYFYILSLFGLNGVPKTKLAKLLYLIDFSWYYDNLESMTNARYVRRQYGPVADIFFELTDSMYDEGKININTLDRGAMMISLSSSTRLQDNLLTEDEKNRIKEIYEIWKDIRVQEIVNFAHEQKPWKSCLDGEYIPYSLIIQEDPEHVYKPYNI